MAVDERAAKRRAIFWALAGMLAFTAADQVTKYLADHYLKGRADVPLIRGVFQLSYQENTGIAWGMFHGMQLQWLFFLVALFILAGMCYVWAKLPLTKRYRVFRVFSVMFCAGALGNAIDRLLRGYVIDFFYFSLISFPVFNVADCYVCISLAGILIFYRNEDFSWMKRSQ